MKLVTKLILIFPVILLGCATRPVGDEKNELATGYRSMLGGMWCGSGFSLTCAERAIEEAKKDCEKEGKTFEYSSHEVGSVRYRCVAKKNE